METTNRETTLVEIVGGVAPSGKWVFFRPETDLSGLDESKLQRFTFEVDPAATKHSVAANGSAYEVLERLGLTSGLDGAIAPGTYNAALRLTTALLRCRRLTTTENDFASPTVSEMFSIPTQVLQQYQYELSRADELTTDDLNFFTKPAPAEDDAEASGDGKTEIAS